MKTIKYKFTDGTINTVGVSDELYATIKEIETKEKHSHWQNTRGCVSLDVLNVKGIDFADESSDFLTVLESAEEESESEKLRKAIAKLKPKQQELINKFYFEKLTTSQIAEIDCVDRSAISHRLATIHEKLKKLF